MYGADSKSLGACLRKLDIVNLPPVVGRPSGLSIAYSTAMASAIGGLWLNTDFKSRNDFLKLPKLKEMEMLSGKQFRGNMGSRARKLFHEINPFRPHDDGHF